MVYAGVASIYWLNSCFLSDGDEACMNKSEELDLSSEPIFKNIFSQTWDELPAVMHKHYANRSYTDDVTVVEGTLDIMCAGPIKLFAPLFWLLGGVPPQNEKNVPVEVVFKSNENNKEFSFNRTFYFKNRSPYNFSSIMIQTKGSEVIEIMRFGIGWKMNYVWEDGSVQLKHKGYVFNFFGHFVPVPLSFFLGKGNAIEIAIDDDNFAMQVDITHPWWGKIYQYKGQFKIKEKL